MKRSPLACFIGASLLTASCDLAVAAARAQDVPDRIAWLTSNRSSVATCKLFDYLAIGRRVLQIPLTRNEAANALNQSALSHVYIDASQRPITQADWGTFWSLPPTPQPDLPRFSKVEQAARLESLLQRADAHTDR